MKRSRRAPWGKAIQKGDVFNKLTALEDGGYLSKVLCRCECGVVKTFHGNNLKSGNTQSCGCKKRRSRND